VLMVTGQVDERGDQRRVSAVEVAPLKQREGKAPASFDPAARFVVAAGGESAPAPVSPGVAETPGNFEVCVRLHLDCRTAEARDLLEIRDILQRHPGGIPVQIRFTNARGSGSLVLAGDRFRVTRNRELLEKLAPWLDG